MKKYVLPNGQTCNKFFSLLAPLHEAMTTGNSISVVLPDKALADYPNLTSNRYMRFPLWRPRLAKFFGEKRYEDFMRRVVLYGFIKNPVFPKKLKDRLIWNSWDDRDFEVTDDFYPSVVKVFSPRKEIIDAVNQMFNPPYKSEGTITVGLHIRRGDYKTFQGGRFFFSDDDWHEFMKKLTEHFSPAHVRFFISTNEQLNSDSFKEFDTWRLTTIPSAAADLYALSLCDYIVGPPSTFSNWAALVGRKPLCHILSREQHTFTFEIPTKNIGIKEL